jgi:outer membrane lipoprotein-sorting protein
MDFDQFAWSRDYGRTISSAGHARLARPSRFRLDYTNGNVAIGDGDDVLWTEPPEGSWPALYRRAHTDVATRVFGVLFGTADLAADYASSICSDGDGPSGTVCVELRPNAPVPDLARFRVWIAGAEATRGRILQLASEDTGGNWNTYRFVASSIRVDPTFDAGLFDLTPPPGAREMTSPGT